MADETPLPQYSGGGQPPIPPPPLLTHEDDDSDDEDPDVIRLPLHRHVAELIIAHFQPGQTISRAWICQHFGIRIPDRKKDTGAVCDRFDLDWLRARSKLEKYLLNKHQVCILWLDRQEAFQWALPFEQLKRGLQKSEKTAEQAFRKAVRIARSTNTAGFTSEQQINHYNQLRKLTMWQQARRDVRREDRRITRVEGPPQLPEPEEGAG